MGKNMFLGVDVGSVSTNVVLMEEDKSIKHKIYLKTQGNPITAIQNAIRELSQKENLQDINILGVGTTGSGRQIAGRMLGADIVKNEISTHAAASLTYMPDVRTVLEIGGQDSKIIILRDGIVTDFAMNSVCAAGTGSFLDRQANRLSIPINEFGDEALKSGSPVRIAGRCAVFAESDMIHKQQNGHSQEDIIAGLCEALVRNYLNNLAKGKETLEPVVFQGGVAANKGIVQAFSNMLNMKINVPIHHDVMGAWGAALMAQEAVTKKQAESGFAGFDIVDNEYSTTSFECDNCPNQCEVVEFLLGNSVIARWGGRCSKWEVSSPVISDY